jgi:nucleotidyltransferase AbiEii toxin of type IV toxin-antitoxin system
MPTLYDELRSLISAFDRNKIDYALCGGIAMAIHGRPRATVDIDILILSESLLQVLTIAEELGYTIRGLDMSFEKEVIEIRRISKVDSATKFVLTLDMILVTDAIRNIWETRVEANWEERKLSVVSREGLIALKKISARPQDIADIAALQEVNNAKS